jgi:misacylated tRNA(Ala) deacylase
MTFAALYLDDMTLKEFSAEVKSVSEEKFVILDESAFYPKSGGVDNDIGVLIRVSDNQEFTVIYTGKFKGEISHEIDPPGLKVGDKVKGIINWERRYELMRYHTAAHLLSGVFWNEGQVKITGNNLSLGKGRIDFNMEQFNRSLIDKYVAKANEIIQKDLSIKSYYITRKELQNDASLTKLVMGIPEKVKNIRIIDIVDFDKQPDGGCHVSKLSEIGKIELIKVKNKGKNNRRLYFLISES